MSRDEQSKQQKSHFLCKAVTVTDRANKKGAG